MYNIATELSNLNGREVTVYLTHGHSFSGILELGDSGRAAVRDEYGGNAATLVQFRTSNCIAVKTYEARKV